MRARGHFVVSFSRQQGAVQDQMLARAKMDDNGWIHQLDSYSVSALYIGMSCSDIEHIAQTILALSYWSSWSKFAIKTDGWEIA